MELGLDGTGVSRGIVKAQDPLKVMYDIAKGARDEWEITRLTKT